MRKGIIVAVVIFLVLLLVVFLCQVALPVSTPRPLVAHPPRVLSLNSSHEDVPLIWSPGNSRKLVVNPDYVLHDGLLMLNDRLHSKWPTKVERFILATDIFSEGNHVSMARLNAAKLWIACNQSQPFDTRRFLEGLPADSPYRRIPTFSIPQKEQILIDIQAQLTSQINKNDNVNVTADRVHYEIANRLRFHPVLGKLVAEKKIFLFAKGSVAIKLLLTSLAPHRVADIDAKFRPADNDAAIIIDFKLPNFNEVHNLVLQECKAAMEIFQASPESWPILREANVNVQVGQQRIGCTLDFSAQNAVYKQDKNNGIVGYPYAPKCRTPLIVTFFPSIKKSADKGPECSHFALLRLLLMFAISNSTRRRAKAEVYDIAIPHADDYELRGTFQMLSERLMEITTPQISLG